MDDGAPPVRVNRGAQIVWVIGLVVVVVVAFVIIGHAIKENLTRPPNVWEHHHGAEGEQAADAEHAHGEEGAAQPDMKAKMAGKMPGMGDGKLPEGVRPPGVQ